MGLFLWSVKMEPRCDGNHPAPECEDQGCWHRCQRCKSYWVDEDMCCEKQHLLMILAEECSELAKEALKAARFGLDRVYEGESNRTRIVTEFSDVLALCEMLGIRHRPYRIIQHKSKVLENMKLSNSLGLL